MKLIIVNPKSGIEKEMLLNSNTIGNRLMVEIGNVLKDENLFLKAYTDKGTVYLSAKVLRENIIIFND